MQTNFDSISKSVSKYTALVLACTMQGRSLDSIKPAGLAISHSFSGRGRSSAASWSSSTSSSSQTVAVTDDEKSARIDEMLSLVRIEITNEGMEVRISNSSEDQVKRLRSAFRSMDLEFIENITSETINCLTIEHRRVFRLLFNLGFDGRDVFDAYEAARSRGSIVLNDSPEVSVAYKQYAAVAKLTKDLEEMRLNISFRCGQFSDDKLNAIKEKMDALWTLITKELAFFRAIYVARAALFNQLQDLIAQLQVVAQDAAYAQAPKRSLRQLIHSDCDAMVELCFFYSNAIWSQFVVEKIVPTLSLYSDPSVSSEVQSSEFVVEEIVPTLSSSSASDPDPSGSSEVQSPEFVVEEIVPTLLSSSASDPSGSSEAQSSEFVVEEIVPTLSSSSASDPSGSSEAQSSEQPKSMPHPHQQYTASGMQMSMTSQVGLIQNNPITGNVQIGAVMRAEGVGVPSTVVRHLIFIADVSASMGNHLNNRSGISKAACFIGEAIDQMKDQDGFDLITFDDYARYIRGGFGTATEKQTLLISPGARLQNHFLQGGGNTDLDKVAQLLDTCQPQGRPAVAYQTIVILVSDGDTNSRYAQTQRYTGNAGASSIVRDALLSKWGLNPDQTRFVAMGVGDNISHQILTAFADDGDFVLLANNATETQYNDVKAEFLRKCRPFTRMEMSGSLTTRDGARGYIETTRGRNHHAAYMELMVRILSKKLPFSVVCSVVMPFLQPEHWLCLSEGETIARTMKFVVPSAQLTSPLSFWVQVRLSGHQLRAPVESHRIEIGDAVDEEVDTAVTSYESAVAITQGQGNQANQGVQGATAARSRFGR